MSGELFTALIGAPLLLMITAVSVYVLTGWSDRRDRLRAKAAERRTS